MRNVNLKLAIVASQRRQKDIAAEAGIDEATMSRIVNGLHTSDATKRDIARVLDMPVDRLFPEAGEQAA